MQQPAGRKKRGCPSVEDIQEKVFEELADQLCILRELGWFDMNYQLDNATVTADILSLPANVKIMKLSSIHLILVVFRCLKHCSMAKLKSVFRIL